MNSINRRHTLDGMRGLAALAVVVYHIPELLGIAKPVSGGLAVDLFFILSGFVIEQAYGQSLRAEMSFRSFMKVRMIRLYPLYLFGAIVYTVFLVASPHTEKLKIIASVAFAVFYLPTPTFLSVEPKFAFPINPVSWSLFFELFVNLLYAAWLYRFRRSSLIIIVLVSAGALILERLFFYSTDGFLFLLDGVPRSLFSFFVGVLIGRNAVQERRRGSIIYLAMLLAIFAASFSSSAQTVYELSVTILVFPVLLHFSAGSKPAHPALRRAYDILGKVSYPAYVIHMPSILWIAAMFPRLFGRELSSLAPWSGLGLLAFIMSISYALDRFYDEPARKRLRAYGRTDRSINELQRREIEITNHGGA